MKISSKARYAVAAMLELAARGNEYVSVAELASCRDIPQTFLEQVLLRLKNEGLASSRRGPDGGYRLARSADRIRLGDIYIAVEGPLNMANGRGGDGSRESTGPDQMFWRELESVILNFLNSVTLEDLANRERELQRPISIAHPYTFSI